MIKKILSCLFILSLLSLPVQAKSKDDQSAAPQPTIDDVMDKLKEALGLTDPQVPQVKLILEDYQAKLEALKVDERSQLHKVLSGNQLYAWDDLQKQVAAQKEKKKHKGQPSQTPPAKTAVPPS